jgi:hypothetical protein
MGFRVYYRTARPVSPAEADALRDALGEANRGRTWLSCEPVHFYDDLEEGRLLGGSKPNFLPDPDDAASAASEGLPDGALPDLIEVLCRLSRDHGVDWEFRHDEVPWSQGSIRGGVADDELLGMIEALDGLAEALREFEGFGEDELA